VILAVLQMVDEIMTGSPAGEGPGHRMALPVVVSENAIGRERWPERFSVSVQAWHSPGFSWPR